MIHFVWTTFPASFLDAQNHIKTTCIAKYWAWQTLRTLTSINPFLKFTTHVIY